MNFDQVIKRFNAEFYTVSDKFCFFNLSVGEARTSSKVGVWHPGVYVWAHEVDGILRVGRSLSNSRKRALEHIADNTGGDMTAYGDSHYTRLYLFNVVKVEDYHWAAALEIYFENCLSPKLKAGRQG